VPNLIRPFPCAAFAILSPKMPIYEFACNACQARVSVFVRSMSSPLTAKCDRCGSDDLRRLISRVTVIKSADDFGSLDDDAMMSGFDESDPKAMAAWARKMRQEMGDDVGPEMDEMIERLESGEGLDGGDDDEGFEDDDDFGDF
jgi:putative FmdB family regulatory protein